MTQLFSPTDLVGWAGTVLSLLFYVLLARRYVIPAYALCIAGAALWMVVGVVLGLPSLIFKEPIVIVVCLHGISCWRKDKNSRSLT
jgi:hypothetical protein